MEYVLGQRIRRRGERVYRPRHTYLSLSEEECRPFLVVKSAIQEHTLAAQSPDGTQEEAGLPRSRRVSTHPLPPPHSKCTNDPAAPHYEREDIR
ncbi:unnamed protein product [Boreogadus saida]